MASQSQPAALKAMTVTQLARAAGVSKPHISMILSGRRRPSYAMGVRLAHVLRITIPQLYAELSSIN